MPYVLSDSTADRLRRHLARNPPQTVSAAPHRPGTAPALYPFRVRWWEPDASWIVYLPEGSLIGTDYSLADGLGHPSPPNDGAPPPADWYLVPAGQSGGTTGTVRAHIQGQPDGSGAGTDPEAPKTYTLSVLLGTPSEDDTAVLTAAVARVSTDDPAAPSVTQIVVGAISIPGGPAAQTPADPTVAAWSVRSVSGGTPENPTVDWQVYAPQWATASGTIAVSDGWYDITEHAASGKSLTAILESAISKDDGSATPQILHITADPDSEEFQNIPAVPDTTTGNGTGQTTVPGTDGKHFYKVPIGRWDSSPEGLIFSQRHIGLIVADPPEDPCAWTVSPVEFVQDDAGVWWQDAYYCRISKSPEGAYTVAKTAVRALHVRCEKHPDDHVNGDL